MTSTVTVPNRSLTNYANRNSRGDDSDHDPESGETPERVRFPPRGSFRASSRSPRRNRFNSAFKSTRSIGRRRSASPSYLSPTSSGIPVQNPLDRPPRDNAVFAANSFRDEIHARDADAWRPPEQAISRPGRAASRRIRTCLEISWCVRSAFRPAMCLSSALSVKMTFGASRRIDIGAHRRHAVPVAVGRDHGIGLIALSQSMMSPSGWRRRLGGFAAARW